MRKIWAALVCLIIVGLTVAGLPIFGDIYDTHSPTYDFVERVADKSLVARAKAYGDLMRRQDMDGLKRESDPAILNDDFVKAVPVVAAYYPSGEPVSAKPIQYSVSTATGDVKRATVIIMHDYQDGRVAMTTTIFNQVNNKVIGFNVRKLSAAERQSLSINIARANPAQLSMLAAVVLEFVFALFTLYICLSSPDVKWKWLWLIFITGGVGMVTFNWGSQAFSSEMIHRTNQTISFEFFHIQWGVSGYWQLLFEPATLYLTFPLGAVVYWARHGRKKSERPVVSPPAA